MRGELWLWETTLVSPTRGPSAARFFADSAMTACAVAPDGRTIVAGEASGRVHFLRLELP
jgi:hypothetical protein